MLSSKSTILVKKADGTSVRMTLDEVRQLKARFKKPSASLPSKQSVQADEVDKTKETTNNNSKATPRRKRIGFIDLEPKPIPGDDFSSPLEEEAPAVHPALTKTSATRDRDLDQIFKKISFSIPSGQLDRARTIVQLFLKDIRSEDEAREALIRSEREGGAGLQIVQAQRIIDLAKPLRVSNISSVADVPAVINGSSLPTTTAPYNSFVHERFPKSVVTNDQISGWRESQGTLQQKSTVPSSSRGSSVYPLFSLSPEPAVRAQMHDIKPVRQTMSPTDEISAITLTDFRRLANTPEEAALRLKQKFVNLKDESIVLYLKGLEAWRESPLYTTYVLMVLEYLARGQKLTTATIDRNVLQHKELLALVAMEKELYMV